MVATAWCSASRSACVGRRSGVTYSDACICHRVAPYKVALIVCQRAVDKIAIEAHISGIISCPLFWWLFAVLCCIAAGCSPSFPKNKQENIELVAILCVAKLFVFSWFVVVLYEECFSSLCWDNLLTTLPLYIMANCTMKSCYKHCIPYAYLMEYIFCVSMGIKRIPNHLYVWMIIFWR